MAYLKAGSCLQLAEVIGALLGAVDFVLLPFQFFNADFRTRLADDPSK